LNGSALQWGGRFSAPPDAALLAFGSSLEDDLVLAPFDVACSRAHVAALRDGGIVDAGTAVALEIALDRVAAEIAAGTFAAAARSSGAEDVHGAIDARVRALEPEAGSRLHAGRSRNDQVATTLLLYARARAAQGSAVCAGIARGAVARATAALADETAMPAATHWQPAQPMLLAFWLAAMAENFARAARRFSRVAADAREDCPLGSGACTGSSLPLDRAAAAAALGFARPSRNALDAAGDRDVVLDLLQADARALLAASRVCGEIVVYCTPQFGYARLEDGAATGSSLMPQKRNPDPFELVRAAASSAIGALAGAQATVAGLALSYHRDLQETKRIVVRETERAFAALDAFARAFDYVRWNDAALAAAAASSYTVATDIADALVARGVPSRRAHELVGTAVAAAEQTGRPLAADDIAALADATGLATFEAPLDARASIAAKRTAGSTGPQFVREALAELTALLDREFPGEPA
jgi:argininosuccinate lyase